MQVPPRDRIGMSEVNAMADVAFSDYFADVFEKTPWIAAAAAGMRPFASKNAMLQAMAAVLRNAEPTRQLALLQAHPVLGGEAARHGAMTAHSTSEQADLGLDRMEGSEERAFAGLNRAYLERFGFPFIIAVRGQRDRAAILAALQQRFDSSPAAERDRALAEVVKIAGFRIDNLVADDEPAAEAEHGLSLSLHVLDTAAGTAGAGLAFTLARLAADGGRTSLATAVTDAGGRWAFLADAPLTAGLYEVVFEAGPYQAARGRDSFYEDIAVRFRLQSGGGHYHIPLILSPFGYSTYRGG